MPVEHELARFRHWLPYTLKPVLWELNRWIAKHKQADTVEVRLQTEQDAIHAISMKVLDTTTEHALFIRFLRRVEIAMRESHAHRLSALQGAAKNHNYDGQLVAGLHQWLKQQTAPGNRVFAAWLMRMLGAWQKGRTESDQ